MAPLNQSAKRAEFATVKLSPPKPNTSRPMNITGQDLMEIPKLKILLITNIALRFARQKM